MKGWLTTVAVALIGMVMPATTAVRAADLTVTREPVGTPLAGFGVCMNPYLYAHPNWPAEVNEGNVRDLERKILELRPQFVRIFFLNQWWDTDTDPIVAKGNPGMRQSLIKTVRLAQDAGATVLMQLWYDPEKYADPDKSARQFAKAIADMRQKHGLTSVRYATLQNEPNDGHKSFTMERWGQLYKAFDAALKEQGIRDQVQIVTGDLVAVDQEKWFAYMGNDLAALSDGYSFHAYWDYWDVPKLTRRVREARAGVDAMPEKSRRPVYVTEFGARGHREQPKIEPGKYEDGRPVADVPLYSTQQAWFMLECLNHGVIGFAQWDLYEAWYDRKMGYGIIGSVESGWKLKPGYHLLKLFTHSVKPGWRTVRVTGEVEGVTAAAVKGDGGNLAVFVLNHGDQKRDVTVGGMGEAGVRHRVWNGGGTGEVTGEEGGSAGVAPSPNGTVRVTIPPGALTVLLAK